MVSAKTKLLKIAFDRVIAVSLVDMNAPLRWINQYFADAVKGFGTAEDEKISNLKETRQLILNGRKQYKKFSYFKVKKLTPFSPRYSSDDTAVLTDEFDLKAKLGNEKVEMRLFFTSVFHYDGSNWKCIAFHGSAPPKNSSTEDTFHVDENKKRILELEQRVEERTAELVHKNKELQLEASLEKVRSASWMMKGTDELVNLVAVLFSELSKLGFDLDGGAIVLNIFDQQSDDITQWIIDANHRFPYSFKHPHFDNPILNDIRKAKQQGVAYFSNTYSRTVKNAFWKYYFANTDFKRFPKPLQKEILNKPTYAQSMALEKNTAILNPNINGRVLTSDQQYIFKRFANVFEQSYTRFLDLQKAEAQAIQAELDLIAIKEAKQKAEQTLAELQATQKQLVQSEKMASLGELTAGIAHEIQNPLNFVNNFAEVNAELIDELETEANKGNLEEVKLLAKDIKENETKINHHGKRADAIVKSMLQHSRKSSGQKELTDINALCDEYLRLSYHGLRAKDKSFNAEFDTQFDTTLAPISVVPQDIGRVILNLINNAFYAVNERQKKDKESGYKPRVTLTTRQEGNQVVIEVADNGTGMPDQVKEKIFQPFFTTKPTGEGTGLGLSLSYDIVIKGHGGTMEVKTKEGEGTNFVVRIPA